MKSRFKDLKQRQLDAGLARWRSAELPARPPSGWIKVIREALGMPAAYLANKVARERMAGVAHSMALEAQATSSEAADTQVQEIAESLLKGSRRELWR